MSSPQQQRAFGAVIFVALIALLAIGVLMTVLAGKSAQNEFDEKTLPVLAVAQKALIAYAAANPTSPGRLPCPDTTNTGFKDASCGAIGANQLGRLPWRTLGLPDLRDGSGECLWYAVSGAFKENPATTPVNSDTNGQLVIKDDAGNTLAGNAIAVILAPGAALPGVTRAAGTSQCGGTNIASDYLDVANAINNAMSPPTTFVAGQPSDTFNDRLVFITRAQFFPAVERRVGGEIRKLLNSYFLANQYYPYASIAGGNCMSGLTRGVLPLQISADCSTPGPWLPAWLTNDQWNLLTYYTVAPACTSADLNCSGTGGFLTVQNGPMPTGNKQALVIEPGPSLPGLGQLSPCGTPANCLDGTENTNGDDIYVMQPASPTFNDIVVIVAP